MKFTKILTTVALLAIGANALPGYQHPNGLLEARATCKPSYNGGSAGRYNACAAPLNGEGNDQNSINTVLAFMRNVMACNVADRVPPVSVITVTGCGGGGNADSATADVPGWYLSTAFIEGVCEPGSKCL